MLSKRSERLTHPTLNFVPKGDVIRKQLGFAEKTAAVFLRGGEKKCLYEVRAETEGNESVGERLMT
jgi:hypothetical protein